MKNRNQTFKSIFLAVIMILMTWSSAVSNDLELFQEVEPPIILEDTSFIQKTATAANTFLVKDIDPPGGSTTDQVVGLVKLGDYVYFSADDGVHGKELWRSDGTNSGTTLVKDIRTGGSDGGPLFLTVMGSEIYFRASDGSSGYELWKSDGTEAGTVLVKDINPSGHGVISPNFHVFGNTMYFQGFFGTSTGDELWKTDGTEAGTVLVKDINPGNSGSSVHLFQTIGSTVYFVAVEASTGRELWKTDGTGYGTTIVKDINIGSSSGLPNPSYLTAIGSSLYFRANSGSTGSELWISDGTNAGTQLVLDIDAGAGSGAPLHFTQLGSNVLFSATDPSKGRELWITDGTAGGTERVKNIYSGTASSNPNSLLAIGSMVYFEATDGSGTHLWKTGGTQASTSKISSVPSIEGVSYVVGTTYYASFSGCSGEEFGKYQASVDTFTGCIEGISGTGEGAPREFTELGEKLLFTFEGFYLGDRQLWVTNILEDLQPPANLDYNATLSTGGSTTWTEVDGSSFEWDLTGPTRQSISGYPNLQHAYRFDGVDDSAKMNDDMQTMSGDPTDEPASFEVWFNPDDLSDDKVIWEIGGESNGISLVLWDDLLTFRVKTGGLIVNISHTITDDSEFHQAVCIVNTESNYAALYYDGVEVGKTYFVGSVDWSGANQPGLGSAANNVGAYSPTDQGDFSSPFFDGDIAIFRFYKFEMVPTQIQSSFEVFSLQTPIISYSPSTFDLTIDTVMSPSASPSNTGGAVTSWGISPALPTGLNFDTNTGFIAGTPTVLSPSSAYTITGTNSGGSDTTTVTIAIDDVVPSISYSPNSFTLSVNNLMSPTAIPSNIGGTVPSTIADGVTVGLYSSLALDSNGYSHVSYYDTINKDLKYATDKSGSWVYSTLDSTDNVGGCDDNQCSSSSLAIDSNDNIHIAYSDITNSNLEYITYDGSSWSTPISLDSTDNVGKQLSLAIDYSDNLHVAYYDLTNGNLEYVTYDGSSWSTPVSLVTTDNVGQYPSIAVDLSDNLHISYVDSTHAHLEYITFNGVTWSSPNEIYTPGAPKYSSLKVDSNNIVHIAFTETGGGNQLKYSYSPSWSEISLGASNAGAFPSLSIDSNNNPHITYNGVSNSQIDYVAYDGSTWSTPYQLVTGIAYGTQSSLAIGSDDNIHVVYFANGAGNQDLNYIEMESVSNIYAYSISPALPNGLKFNFLNGKISGTPTVATISTTYTITARNSGGTGSTTITLSVSDIPPSGLTYSPNSFSLIKDVAMSAVTPTSSGGLVTSWSISPALPNGLNFDTGTGVISGASTVLLASNVFTITATNSGGSDTATVTIVVNDAATSISYSGNPFTLTKGTPVTITPTNTGGPATSWTITGTLPLGLNFDTSTGVISGTPTELDSGSAYGVTASNSNPTDSFVYVSITVNDAVPSSLAYSPNSFTLTKDVAMSTVTPTSSGGAVTSWSISPTLPTGINFDTNTGVISGTSTTLSVLIVYTITATNSGGTDTATVTIVVKDAVPNIAYSPSTFHLTKGTAMYIPSPSNTGGAIPSAIIDSSISDATDSSVVTDSNGFSHIAYYDDINYDLKYATDKSGTWVTSTLDNTGQVGQYTSIAVDSNDYIYISYYDVLNGNLKYATDKSGSWVYETLDSFGDVGKYSSIAISTTDKIHISYMDDTNDNLRYATNKNGYWATSTLDSTGLVGMYTSIALDSNNKVHISYYDSSNYDLKYVTDKNGAWNPNAVYSDFTYAGLYTSIAIDNSGNAHISFYDLTYDNLRYTTCSTNCHQMASWTTSIVDSGSVGLHSSIALDSSGFPHISYYKNGGILKYAKYDGSSWTNAVLDTIGSVNQHSSIYIDSDDIIHFSYYNRSTSSLRYLEMASTSNTYDYSISPTLPSGLIFNRFTGEISGTPAIVSASTAYTVTARNSGGAGTTTVTMVVDDIAPSSLTYSPNSFTLTKDAAMSTVTPTLSGGAATSWTISPVIVTGLNFDTSTGVISGTPTVVSSSTVYTITAINSGGSDTATVTITVNDIPVSDITYAGGNLILTIQNSIASPDTPTTTGGAALSWETHPALPDGLMIDSNIGYIHGTPTILQAAVTYTIWANNSGGQYSTQLDITINDNTPIPLNYFGNDLILTNNQAMTSIEGFDQLKPDLLAAGEDHTCAIEADGSVSCWGKGGAGRLGNGGTAQKNSPTATSSLGIDRTAVDITAGAYHTCAVLDDGSVVCWGSNDYGQIGDGTTTGRWSPTQTISIGRPAVAIEAGAFNTCALLDNGSVSCWGRNHQGQLGRGYSNSTSDIFQRTPGLTLPMPGGRPIIALDISHYMVCGVVDDGSIACWGAYGGGDTPSLQTFFDASNPAIDVATGRHSACGLLENGSVNCWGTGFLGTGGSSQTASPGVIWPNLGSGRTAVQVELGRYQNCALLDDDSVKCWGKDDYGQMGNGAGQSNQNTPVSASFASGLVVRDIIAGHWHTCVAMQTNEMYCWGDGEYGKLGDGSTSQNNYAGSSAKVNYFSGTNPVKAHGDITSWSISPALPTGININPSTGEISGTPSVVSALVVYTITALNSGGSKSTIVTITVNDEEPSSLTYSPNSFTLTKDAPMSTVTPTSSGGAVTSWSITPALSTGLNFDTSTGVISGTPTVLAVSTVYTITATNTGGSDTATVTIVVNDVVPSSLAYSPNSFTLTKDTPMSTVTPTSSGGAVTSWSISPALSTGLNFDTSTGVISGTPTVLAVSTVYTITATNTGGSDTATVTIVVDDAAPSSLTYSPNSFTLTKDTPMSTVTPTSSGGAVTSWSISPALSTGLNFDTSTGVISGTPTVLAVSTVYTITATNTGGSDTATVTIVVNDIVPSFTYPSSSYTFTKDQTIPTIYPINTGGAATTWEVSDLPDGLAINSADGYIWGIVISITSTTTYTVWANNTGGPSSTTITITVNDVVPLISYSPNSLTLTKDIAMSTLNPTTSGGTITSWAISPALSTGLNFDTSTGVISGTPTVVSSSTVYTITAINSGGSDTATVTIVVNDKAPIVTYYPYEEIIFTKGVALSPTVEPFTNPTGGVVTSWGISPSLGYTYFEWDNTDGSIGGSPSNTLPRTQFTITATNSGGSLVTYVNITINDVAPVLSYSPNSFTLTKDTAMSPTATPTNSGGAIPSGIIDSSAYVGQESSIAVDPNGFTHIAHYDDTNADLKYTSDKSGSWVSITVDTTGFVGKYPSIARDSNGKVHISYFDDTNDDLKYATDLSGAWVVSSIVTANDVGKYSSIAIDLDNKVHISYYDDSYNYLKYVTNKAGSWVISTVDSSGNAGFYTSIGLDSNDNIHIAYGSQASGLKYATDKTGSWAYSIIDSTNYCGYHNSMAVDSNGKIHISHYELNEKNLRYSTDKSGAWVNTIIDSSGSVGFDTSLALDPNQNVHISYFDLTEDSLQYATNKTGSWVISVLDENGQDGSIAVDSNGRVHVSYYDDTVYQLAYTTLDSASNILGYSISPSLPAGLTLNIGTGVISGTPTVLAVSTIYTITATNTGGSDTATVTIVVDDAAPNVVYSPSSFTLTKDVAMSTLSPTTSGGAITSWAISPALSTGLNFDTSTGVISGTPTVLAASTVYTVTAINSGGSTTATVTIMVKDAVPNIVYSPSSFTLTKDVAMTAVTPTNSGGIILSWSISPTLPTGLNIDTATGEISGTATILSPAANYMVTAVNSGGDDHVMISIEVNDLIPTITYSPSTVALVRGYEMTNMVAITSGGIITTWGIHPTLPAGLSFAAGTISGTPASNQTSAAYTVFANNSGGSVSTDVHISVNEPTPNIDYDPDDYTMTKGTSVGIYPIMMADPPAGPITSISDSSTYNVNDCLIHYGNLIFFQATDSTHGRELWIFDHTLAPSASNPSMLKDINPGTASSIGSYCVDMLVVNGMLFFAADDGTNGKELWKSDGTPSGTQMVKDVRTGTIGSNPEKFSSIGTTLFFEVSGGSFSYQTLFKSDGTSVGTVQVGSSCYNVNCHFSPQVEYNGSYYGEGWGDGRELFVINGDNYEQVIDLNPGGGHSNPRSLTVYDGWLYFMTYDGPSGACLYRTNGAESGTSAFICGTNPFNGGMAVFNDELYFVRAGSGNDYELWKTDGTIAGTTLVKDIIPGSGSSFCPNPGSYCSGGVRFYSTQNYLLFDVDSDGNYYPELWKTDGTEAGTEMLTDVNIGGYNIDPFFNEMNNVVYFKASDSISGSELWRTDGTAAGTARGEDVRSGSDGSAPKSMMDVNGDLYFIAYDGSNYTFFKGEDAGNAIIGAPVSWSITPAVPNGLNFDNGLIWGTPTVLQPTAVTYTITATNANGSSSTTIDITINDVIPTISYSPSIFTLTKDVAMSPTASPTTSGGAVTSWAISPALPNGLNIDSATGEISGTSTVVSPETVYTVSASNSGGSVTASVTITVNDGVPNIIYSPASLVLTKDVAMSPTATPISSGGAVVSWSISPVVLPDGLNFDTSTGEISGTPTIITSTQVFLVTATNSGGTSQDSITITVNDAIPSITYSPSSLVLTKDSAMSPTATPTNIGGSILSWTISPTLPTGLNFDTATGEISGTPTALSVSVPYSVNATNSGGMVTTTVTITVNDVIPTINYSPSSFVLTKDSVMSPTATPITSGGIITTWAITPALPTGLNFDTATGEISGTPTVVSDLTTYTVTATNSGGFDTTSVTITVNDVIPTISYSPSSFVLTKDSVMSPTATPTTSGGIITTWAITPTLSTGLNFDTATGEISGTPTVVSDLTTYTVTATNSGGFDTTSVTITVDDVIPTISYSPNSFIETKDIAMTTTTPTSSGGIVTSWAITPTLPTGLNFDTATGEISGTPTVISSSAVYTITAINTGGSDTTTITIIVNDEVSTIAYSPNSFIETKDIAMTTTTPTTSGGIVTSWAITPTLPTGLNFDTATGALSGTPTVISPSITYTVTATNSGGLDTAIITIVVNDVIPTISYSPNSFIETKDIAMTTTTPTSSGGIVTSWAITPTLPTGLNFDTATGALSGTPTVISPSITYTVTATNSGGLDTATITIVVNDDVPTISYSPDDLNLVNNTVSSDLPLSPIITGSGVIVSWAISPSMPSGLAFSTSTGVISGTPNELLVRSQFTIIGTNTGGTSTAYVNITIVDEIPMVAYSPENLTLFNGTISSDLPLSPTITGSGDLLSWSITPSLPSGLIFSTTSGTISGIATVLQLSPVAYTITAINSGGVATSYLNITVLHESPTFTYPSYNLILENNTVMTPIVATIMGGEITSWEIDPAAPNGVLLNTDGSISGTPTVVQSMSMYRVWGNNSGGYHSIYLNITIYDSVVTLEYNPENVTLTKGAVMVDLVPTYDGIVDDWSVYPNLPSGLAFSNGVISGTPAVNLSRSTYTVWANNTGGPSSHTINITIIEPIAVINYSPNNREETRTISMIDWIPITSGGAIETWEISPQLPLGLTFVEGVISGVPTVNSTEIEYTVWANNSGGPASTIIHLSITEPVVTITYLNYELTLIRNVTITPLVPQLTGGNAELWEIYPELPQGLNFVDGTISGTPQVNSTRTMYTVWANNSGGSTNVSLNVTILEPSANIIYNPTNLILTRGEMMESVEPEVDGGNIETWEIDPALPIGLEFDNGKITGTPLENMTIQTYLVYVNNSGGPSFTAISITINEPAPSIEYSIDNITLVRGENSLQLPLAAIFGGGEIASFTVEPALPDGLNFTNGTIFGTPTVNSSLVQYNITAINSGGGDYFLLNITIIEPVAILAADPTYFVLTRGESEMNLTFNRTGGMVETWTVSPDLPAGLVFGNGTISGIPTVNASLATYKIFANNTGGSTNITINIKILEPISSISYSTIVFNLINSRDTLSISPEVLGGNPETWEFEPSLPEGIIFTNGVFSGTPIENMTTTTYIIWANNSGGSASTTIELTVDQPFYVVRYPVTLLVLNASQNMVILEPIYYFDEEQEPVWTVSPDLPEGLSFVNGAISGVPTASQSLTTYEVTISGEMVPTTLFLMIEILDEYIEPTIEPTNNSTLFSNEIPTDLEPIPDEEPDEILYWLFPLLLIFCLWFFAMIYNLKNRDDESDLAQSLDGALENDG